MKLSVAVPSFISFLRVAAVPLFLFLFDLGNITACLGLLAFCAATDFFDGYAARKLDASTKFGTYFDSTTDFILMLCIYAFFSILGTYPFWLPLLIVVSFVQFLITNRIFKKLYDPIGKYLGSALYIGLTLTLLFPVQTVYDFVQYAFVVFLSISLLSRIISIRKQRKTNN